MYANFFTEINNLGTKGQSIGVTCRAVALRGGGFALFAGCFVPQNSPPHPKTRHICPGSELYERLAPRCAILYQPGATPQGLGQKNSIALRARFTCTHSACRLHPIPRLIRAY